MNEETQQIYDEDLVGEWRRLFWLRLALGPEEHHHYPAGARLQKLREARYGPDRHYGLNAAAEQAGVSVFDVRDAEDGETTRYEVLQRLAHLYGVQTAYLLASDRAEVYEDLNRIEAELWDRELKKRQYSEPGLTTSDLGVWRDMLGMTQAELASRAGVSTKTVRRAEKGEAAKKTVSKLTAVLEEAEAAGAEEEKLPGWWPEPEFFDENRRLIFGYAWRLAHKYGGGMNHHDLWDLVGEALAFGYPYAVRTFDPEKANHKDTPREALLKWVWGKMRDVIKAEADNRRKERGRTVSTAAMSRKSGEEAEILGEGADGERFSTWGE